MSSTTLNNIFASIGYSVIGIVIFIVAFKAMQRVLPFDVNKELAEDQNTAVGILLGSVMIGLAVIIAAAIH